MKKRFIITILLITLIVSLLIIPSCGSGKKAEEKEVIKIGAILPLTGPGAKYGEMSKKAIDLYFKDKTYCEIKYYDTEGKPANAVSIVNRLKNSDVDYFIGFLFSAEVNSIANILKDKTVISPTASQDIISSYPNVLRVCETDSVEAKLLAEYLINNEIREIGVVYWKNDWANNFYNNFNKFYKGKIIITETYVTEDKDYKNILYKLKDKKVKYLLLISSTEVVNILDQMKEIDYKPFIIGTSMFDANTIISKLQMDDFNYSYTSRIPDKEKLSNDILYNKFLELYNQEPDIFALLSFDAAILLDSLLPNKTYKDVENIKINGIFGEQEFNKNGDVIKINNITVRTNK